MDVIVTSENLAGAHSAPQPSGGLQPETTGAKPVAIPDPKPKQLTDDVVAAALKLVPGEVAVAYTALLPLVPAAAADPTGKWAAPSAIITCCVLIVMLIRRAGRVHTPPVAPHPTQYVVSVLAFVAWALAIRNPLDGFGREVPTWITNFSLVLLPIFGGIILGERPPRRRKDA